MIDKIQNIKNVPELRFPEFSGEWVEKKLGDIGMFTGGGTPDTNEKIYWTGDIPWISSSDIQEYNIHSVNISHYITNHAVLKSATKIIPAKSVLIVSRVGVGKFAVVNREICTSQDFTNLTPQYEDVYYLAYYFTAKANRFVRYSQGTSIKGFTSSDIKSLRFNLSTDIREQKKIANFLMQVDMRIDKLEEKKEKLEEYKKGVMQKIFSQEIRFKDDNGEDFPDWEKKRLGDILDYVQPTKYLVSNTEYDDSYNIPVLTAGKTFILGYTNESTGIFQKKLPTIIFDDFTTAFKYVDFAFKAKSSAMKMLIPNSLDVNLRFIYESMKFIKFPLSEHKRYWISEFQNEKINYPSYDEQNKIANFLTSIDKQIEKVSSQIESSKIFKNGLLQKMYV